MFRPAGGRCVQSLSALGRWQHFYFSILISHKFSACQTLLGVMILFIIEFTGEPRRHSVALLRCHGWSGADAATVICPTYF